MARTNSKSASTIQVPIEQLEPIAVDSVVVVDTVQTSKKQKKTKVVDELKVDELKVDEPKVENVSVIVDELKVEDVVDVSVIVDETKVEDVSQQVMEIPFNNTLIKLTDFGKKINDLTTILSSLKLEYKTLEKGIGKDIKSAQKHLSKGKRNGIKRAPTGFVKPTLISDELAVFLNLEPGSEIGRTSASKEVHNYIKANQLNTGRTIHPDLVLSKILNYYEGDTPVLTYLNLQTYLKHHFIGNKNVAVITPVVDVVV